MNRSLVLAAVCFVACPAVTPTPDGGSGGGTAGGGGGGSAETDGGTGGGGVVVTGECGLPANETKRQALVAAQPVIEGKKKATLTVAATWPSEGGNATITCSVDLKFKDSNGNGTLDGYEDWRRTATERTSDLLPKLSTAQKLGLLAHAQLSDVPTTAGTPSAATQAVLGANVRFGVTSANTIAPLARATWANAVQELAEESSLGVPFLISSAPSHSSGNGRVKGRALAQFPNELSLAASGSTQLVEGFGKIVNAEYRALGIRMALSPSADLATDPRWQLGQFTFGEDSTAVGGFVSAYIKGLQGTSLGRESVAAVAGSFPGAGAAKGGLDARLAKGKFLAYPGNKLDEHLAPFQKAIEAGVAGISTAYGVPETGVWTAQAGTLNGSSIEQVGASFNQALVTGVLRTRFTFGGLVVAPAGVLEAEASLGAPWGVESLTKPQRIGKAINAGVDQFIGLADTTALDEALTANQFTVAQLDASAGRALALLFRLGLFEDPYVDAAAAPTLVNTDLSYRAGLDAMTRGMVLLVNADKPSGFLNGAGDGTQSGDKGNAGNGSMKVLPAPPGEPYVSAGCSFFILGDFDLDYVRSVSAGYGELTNDATSIKGVTVTTPAQRMALSDYVFIRMTTPFTRDADSGALNLPTPLLEYAGAANASELADIATAKAAIAAWTGAPASRTQIIVGVDGGRLPVVRELLALGINGLYVQWSGQMPGNASADKIFLDVAFGIANGVATLPAALPASDVTAATQLDDVAGDGAHSTFSRGFGLGTSRFQ